MRLLAIYKICISYSLIVAINEILISTRLNFREVLIMQETEEKGVFMDGLDEGIKTIVKNSSEKALNSILKFIGDKYGKASVATGSAFKLYLKNSELRYNKVKTLADMTEPRTLEGKNGIYVDVYVDYKGKRISTSTVDNMMQISNNIIVLGSGGTGKSMLMRHLFVNTQHRGSYIPVLVELRKISNADKADSLLKMIHSCIEEFDVRLDQTQFEYSLRSGKYLLLLDGLDEVKEEIQDRVENLIQELSKKYPRNGFIISSRREGVDFNELETYTVVRSLPLKKEQAVELINRIGKNGDKVKEFSGLLFKELFDKHKDFASNPLLLTMMYITFVDNNIIPEHLTDFYEAAYDALYKRHDANKDGVFERDYKCKKLGEKEFKDLFSYFCFQSYFMQQYEFNKEEIFEYIKNGMERLNLKELIENPEMFFNDIKDIVCLIVDEGSKFKFTHRSFQTYFAAYYTATQVPDEQQKTFLSKEIRNQNFIREDFFYMLNRLEGDRFSSNILEPGIRRIMKKIKESESPEVGLLTIMCQSVSVHERRLLRGVNSAKHMKIPYERKILMLYNNIYYKAPIGKDKEEETIVKKLEKMKQESYLHEIEIAELVALKQKDQTNDLIDLLISYLGIKDLLGELSKWMVLQENKRNNIKKERDRIKMLALL